MATFLARAFDLEPAATAGFTDTAGNSHAAAIDALAGAGITAGCATVPARYCPDDPVTRGQMATFLARALNLVPLPEPAVTDTGPAESDSPRWPPGGGHACGLRADGTIIVLG